jgi:hypothetical protein
LAAGAAAVSKLVDRTIRCEGLACGVIENEGDVEFDMDEIPEWSLEEVDNSESEDDNGEEEEEDVYRCGPVKKQPGLYYIHVSLVCYGYCLPFTTSQPEYPSNIFQLER